MAKKILLIEDDKSICSMLQEILIEQKYDVVLATEGGDEGILMAVTESPDLILIATTLSVIDGWQTIQILKASTVTQHIPIIALMALTTEAEWDKVSESGCDDYELKPIDLNSILTKIKTLLRSTTISTSSDPSHSLESPLFQNYQPILNKTSQIVSSKSMVVYIDDNPADSQAMASIVQDAGYGYDNIAEPLKALPLLLDIKPKLIFLDLVMPWTNGYEMCAQIRRASAFKRTPIIIVTNNDGIIDRVRAKIVGASGFFSKPVKKKQVLRVLKKHLNPMHSQ